MQYIKLCASLIVLYWGFYVDWIPKQRLPRQTYGGYISRFQFRNSSIDCCCFWTWGIKWQRAWPCKRNRTNPVYALDKRGVTQLGITVDIGFNPGAISRELGRNRGLRGYRFLQAHRFAVQRGLARKGVARVMTPCLIVWAEILLLDNQWSPEQISDALNREDGTKVSYESLYRHI